MGERMQGKQSKVANSRKGDDAQQHASEAPDIGDEMVLRNAESSIGNVSPKVLPASIRFEHWGYRHASRRHFAVRGLNLDIRPGEHVLLLGASGIGKSTILEGASGLLGGDAAEPTSEAGRMTRVKSSPLRIPKAGSPREASLSMTSWPLQPTVVLDSCCRILTPRRFLKGLATMSRSVLKIWACHVLRFGSA